MDLEYLTPFFLGMACLSLPIRKGWRSIFIPPGLAVLSGGILFAVQLEGLPLYAYLRGFTGDLSVPMVLLLADFSLRRGGGFNLLPETVRNQMFLVVAVLGLLFYPLALGLSPYDPYRLGYGSLFLSLGLLVLTFFFWGTGRPLTVLFVPLSLLAHSLQLYESTNLWDYILDPFLFLWALVRVFRRLSGSAREKDGSGFSEGATAKP